jgi:hypothetical protein
MAFTFLILPDGAESRQQQCSQRPAYGIIGLMRNICAAGRWEWLWLAIMMVTLAACLPQNDTPGNVAPAANTSAAPLRAPAPVEAIEILKDGSSPVQVTVIVRGHFPDECAAIDQISQERRGNTYSVTIDSIGYAGGACAQTRVAFEKSIVLDVIGQPAGTYLVDVNGLQGTFRLQRDNVRDEGNAVLGGLVWLDRCNVPTLDDTKPIETPPGCVSLGEGRYRGDGERAADEQGIGGVKVHLGTGPCPSTGLATTLTSPDGTFLFSGLAAGDYCLTGDGSEEGESPLAGDGMWTFPAGSSGELSVTILPGESNLGSTFGWTVVKTAEEPAYFATPPLECTNMALFVSDLTVPDNTQFLPGTTFTKTWQLENLGSCQWGPGYELAFAGGDRMDAPDRVPLTVTVPPGEFVDLSVQLVAPEVPGEYQGEWKLAGPDGDLFGVGPGSDRAFWVRIVVIEEAANG